MNGRTNEILRIVDRLDAELIDLLSGLTVPDLATPCDDPSGPTVGAIVAHLAEGRPQAIAWLTATVRGLGTAPVPGPGAASGHDHPHGDDHGHDHGHDRPSRRSLVALGFAGEIGRAHV